MSIVNPHGSIAMKVYRVACEECSNGPYSCKCGANQAARRRLNSHYAKHVRQCPVPEEDSMGLPYYFKETLGSDIRYGFINQEALFRWFHDQQTNKNLLPYIVAPSTKLRLYNILIEPNKTIIGLSGQVAYALTAEITRTVLA